MLPAPLTPNDCDLRGLAFMPVDLVRLFDSDLYALSTGDEFKAAFTLWGKSFLQLPAASLPDDDRVLAHLSGAGKKWAKVKEMALRGWIRCSDGRLYHPVVAVKAIDAWERRLDQRNRAKKRWKKGGGGEPPKPNGADATAMPRHSHGNASAVVKHSASLMQGTGTGTGTIEHSNSVGSASARELPLDRLMRLMNLDHRALQRKPQFQAFAGFLHDWKLAGCDPERDIWPTIERLVSRSQDIGSPRFFERAIFKARDDRVASEPSETERWATRLEAFRVNGFWPTDPPPLGFGPRPGDPGCLCPPELLMETAA